MLLHLLLLFFFEETYTNKELADVRYRILALCRYWNIIQYYNPYLYLIKSEWGNIQDDLIPQLVDARTFKRFQQVMLRLNASIKDGHAGMPSHPATISKVLSATPVWPLPFKVAIINSHIYIKTLDSVFAKKYQLQVGDEIVEINGIKAKEKLDFFRAVVSHSRPEIKDFFIERSNLFSYISVPSDSFKISVERNMQIKNAKGRVLRDDWVANQSFLKEASSDVSLGSNSIHLINDSVAFLNVHKWTKLDRYSSLLTHVKHVIIDCRNYPTWDFIEFSTSFFFKASTDLVRFAKVRAYPGVQFVNLKRSGFVGGRFNGKIIIIMSEQSMSRSEMLIMYFKGMENATFVGRTTVGADGDIAPIPMIGLPEFRYRFSSIGVYFPDYIETQGVGISPDVYVERNIRDIIDKRDSILCEAIAITSGSKLQD